MRRPLGCIVQGERQQIHTTMAPVAPGNPTEMELLMGTTTMKAAKLSRFAWLAGAALIAAGAFAFWQSPVIAAEDAVVIPAPTVDEKPSGGLEKAVFAGGCFWGVQGVFQHVKGVANAVSGYSGGDAETAHYQDVGSGATGHAESVEVTYGPSKVTDGQPLHGDVSVSTSP